MIDVIHCEQQAPRFAGDDDMMINNERRLGQAGGLVLGASLG
jgi:hypothetical protein